MRPLPSVRRAPLATLSLLACFVACVPNPPSLGGADVGQPGDAGPQPDTGALPADAGFLPTDTGLPLADAGRAEDTGLLENDAGFLENDAGFAEDAGFLENDAGFAENDAGFAANDAGFAANDAGSPEDAGQPPADSGVAPPDAGPPLDVGPRPDAGPTPLAQLAATMQPGTWAPLTVADQDAVLGVGNVSGTMIHYSNSMPWNPWAHAVEILAEDHNWGAVRYARYDERGNRFVLVTADAGLGTNTQHGYDHSSVNPSTGDYYYRPAWIGDPTIAVKKKLLSSATTFTDLPLLPTNYEQIAIASTWWSGPFLGAGNQGCLMIFNSGDSFGNAMDGQVAAYDPLTNSWFYNQHGMAPLFGTNGFTYHSVMEYSAPHNMAVYGGGNAQPTRLWRLSSDATFIEMPEVPSGKAVGVQRGNLVADPVSGNFLLLSAGELWELDPTGSGTWTAQTGARVPPPGVGVPGPNNPEGVISSAISDYGVVVYVTQSSRNGGTFYVYKHR